MAAAINATNSVRTNLAGTGFNSLLADAAPSLDISSANNQRPVLELITQYLFPQPQDWITEWTGPRGYDVIHDVLTRANTSLKRDTVSLVVQYLKKSDIFGLDDLENAAGKAEEPSTFNGFLVSIGIKKKPRLPDGKEELIKLIGKYGPERALPLDIDDEMQKDVSQVFEKDKDTLWHWDNSYKKITNIYSLYWCPRGISANIIKSIAVKHGVSFLLMNEQVDSEYCNMITRDECWIQFPNAVLGIDRLGQGKTLEQQEALIPKGFEVPYFQDAVFCVFMKYIFSAKKWGHAWTFTRCKVQGKTGNTTLFFGGYSPPHNSVYFAAGSHYFIRDEATACCGIGTGVAIVRRYHGGAPRKELDHVAVFLRRLRESEGTNKSGAVNGGRKRAVSLP